MNSTSSTTRQQGTEGHNTASIGGLVMLPPVTLSFATQASHGIAQAWQRARAATIQHLLLTHDSSKLASYAEVWFCGMLCGDILLLLYK